ncbi:hypothetical protein PMAYCL1PPCAC_12061 [Pristionchus mayeri]|uniref:Uncharacterized protein n=1 Tax=Pristionchus mayeri TaxID=1317129 RepID=A0AAN4ZJB2_9BILA|nr:hypothetical protein PMAYCL1PPCAC_12061 [Pristionchus mayeri]
MKEMIEIVGGRMIGTEMITEEDSGNGIVMRDRIEESEEIGIGMTTATTSDAMTESVPIHATTTRLNQPGQRELCWTEQRN